MDKTYKKLLSELKKGNAVLLEVCGNKRGLLHKDRYRIVTPHTCEYDVIIGLPFYIFSPSCFCMTPRSTENLINSMIAHDRMYKLKIVKMQVLK